MYDELVKELREAEKHAKEIGKNPYRYIPYYGKAADAIEELQADKTALNGTVTNLLEQIKDLGKPSWIPVTERVPDDKRDVQITVFWHDAWRTMYGYYDGAYWHLYDPMHTEVADVYVIGWMEKPTPMPLPQPPKEET